MLSEAEENLAYWMGELMNAKNKNDKRKAQFFVQIWKDQVEQDVKLLDLWGRPKQ